MLYSGHKESGLIRILLSIGLGGPGWARGLYMDRKAEKPGPASLLPKEYAPALHFPGRSGVRGFFFGGDI